MTEPRHVGKLETTEALLAHWAPAGEQVALDAKYLASVVRDAKGISADDLRLMFDMDWCSQYGEYKYPGWAPNPRTGALGVEPADHPPGAFSTERHSPANGVRFNRAEAQMLACESVLERSGHYYPATAAGRREVAQPARMCGGKRCHNDISHMRGGALFCSKRCRQNPAERSEAQSTLTVDSDSSDPVRRTRETAGQTA